MQPVISPPELSNQLDHLRDHVQVANQWAEEHLRAYPNIQTVAVTFGANFILSFDVTLTWHRNQDVTLTWHRNQME